MSANTMYVRTKEAADILGISERMVQRWAKSGKLESREVPGRGRGGKSIEIKVLKNDEKLNDTPVVNPSKKLLKNNEKINDNTINDTSTEIFSKKLLKNNEKTNDTAKTTPKKCRKSADSSYDMSLVEQTIDKKEDKKRQTTQTTGCNIGTEKPKTLQNKQDKKNDAMLQGGVTQGVTSDVVSLNSKQTKEIDKSLEWIPVDRGVTLSSLTKMTLYRRVKKNQIESLKVPDKSCGFRTYLRVKDISPAVELKWHEIQRTKHQKHLPAVLQKEKTTFETRQQEDRSIAWARLAVVKSFYEVHDLAAKTGKLKTEADSMFLQKLDQREILADEMHALGEITLGLSTIKRWVAVHKKSGNSCYPVSLIPGRRGNVGRPRIRANHIEARIRFLASDDVNLPGTIIYRKILKENDYTEETCPMSPSTIYNLITKVRKETLLMAARKSKEAYKNLAKPHLHRVNDCEPNDIWESDGHTMNNVCYNPFFFQENYKPLLRPVMMAWLDVATGLCTGWVLYSSETFHLVVTSFGESVSRWGIPKMVKLDNGSAYKNAYTAPDFFAYKKTKTQTAAKRTALQLLSKGFKGFFQELGVGKVQYVHPRNPESKMIEPAWRYMLVEFEKSVSLYMGESPKDRPDKYSKSYKKLIKEYKNEILSWDEYVQELTEAIDEYNNRKREVLQSPSGPLSPIEMFQQFPENINIPSIAEIDMACRDLFPVTRTVSRGEINVMGMYYRHPLMGNYLGRKVQVYFDERNLQSVQIASMDGEIWPTPAQRIVESYHMNPDKFQEAIQSNQKYQKCMLKTYAVIQNEENDLSIADKDAIADNVSTMLEEQSTQQKRIKNNQQKQITSRFTISEMMKSMKDETPVLGSSEETEEPQLISDATTEKSQKKQKKTESPFLKLSKKVTG
jgi:transposase